MSYSQEWWKLKTFLKAQKTQPLRQDTASWWNMNGAVLLCHSGGPATLSSLSTSQLLSRTHTVGIPPQSQACGTRTQWGYFHSHEFCGIHSGDASTVMTLWYTLSGDTSTVTGLWHTHTQWGYFHSHESVVHTAQIPPQSWVCGMHSGDTSTVTSLWFTQWGYLHSHESVDHTMWLLLQS